MTYQYSCQHCGINFDIIKPASQYDCEETCPKCKLLAVREFVPQRVHFSGTKVQEAEYNPGLGCIVQNKQHRAEICKQRGLEEIGSEPVESVHKHYDTRREEKLERTWAEADKGWVGSE